jgi:hypothetical protein
MWILLKGVDGWSFSSQSPTKASCRVTLPQTIAWRVFTKGISRESARSQIEIHGDPTLADGVLGLTAIIG